MRHIHALSDDKVPRDDEFKFRERAKVLVDKWHDVLKTTNGAPESKPAANGARKEDGPASTNGKSENGATEAKANGVAAMEVDADAKAEAEPPGGGGIA